MQKSISKIICPFILLSSFLLPSFNAFSQSSPQLVEEGPLKLKTSDMATFLKRFKDNPQTATSMQKIEVTTTPFVRDANFYRESLYDEARFSRIYTKVSKDPLVLTVPPEAAVVAPAPTSAASSPAINTPPKISIKSPPNELKVAEIPEGLRLYMPPLL